jgi:hypothetical protein
MTIYRDGKEPEKVSMPVAGNGFSYEIIESMACITENKLESDIMSHAETVEIMRIMDTLRAQWGVKYPSE